MAAGEQTVTGGMVPAGFEFYDQQGDRWLLVKRVEDPGGGRIILHTDEGEHSISFFAGYRVRHPNAKEAHSG